MMEDLTNPKDRLGDTKVDLSLFPAVAILHGAHAMVDGSAKYGPYNWRSKDVRARVYVAACKRHLDAWLERQEVAEDSGVHHLGHAMACCGILLDAQENGRLVDDRPLSGAVDQAYSKTLKRINAQVKARAKKKRSSTSR